MAFKRNSKYTRYNVQYYIMNDIPCSQICMTLAIQFNPECAFRFLSGCQVYLRVTLTCLKSLFTTDMMMKRATTSDIGVCTKQ